MARTRDKILDVAERLFAEQGIDGTSLRAITGEAGVNLGSIHYYFGSKAKLVSEVLRRKARLFMSSTSALLEEAIQRDPPPSIEEVLKIDFASKVRHKAEHPHYFQFFARLLHEGRRGPLEEVAWDVKEYDALLLKAVCTTLPDRDPAHLSLRISVLGNLFVLQLMNTMLWKLEMQLSELDVEEEELIQEYLDIMAAGLKSCRPISKPK